MPKKGLKESLNYCKWFMCYLRKISLNMPIYLIKETNFILLQSGKKSFKHKGKTPDKDKKRFASYFINDSTNLINDDNRYKNESSVKILCTYNFNYSSHKKLTSLSSNAKETLNNLVEIKSNPILNIRGFITIILKYSGYTAVNESKVFYPTYLLKVGTNVIKLPPIYVNNVGKVKLSTLTTYLNFLDTKIISKYY